jgi:opacity protein-like surface antigen
VAEIFTEKAASSARVNSALVGAIWKVSDGLTLDVGVRYAQSGPVPIHELRAGLTWSFGYR